MATVVPVALLAGAAVAAPASAMTARSATFDAGGFGEWDLQPNVAGPGSPSVTTTTSNPCAGAQSARASVGAGSGNKFARTIWGGTVGDPQALNWGDGSDIWYGTALYLPNGFGAAMQSYYVPMRWDTYGVSNVTRSGVSMYAGGQWQLFAEQDGVHPQANLLPSTFKLSEGVWHTLEVHQRLSGSAGSALNELYVDGVRMGSSTAPNYFGTPVSAIRYGIVAIDQDRQTNALSVQYDSPYAGPTRRSIGCGTTAPAPAPSTPAAPAPAPSTPAPSSPGADSTAPSAPANLRATGGSGVGLAWDAATDASGVAKYEVWRGDAAYGSWVLAGTVAGNVLSFRDNPGSGTWTYGIRAFDGAGNKSASSNVISAASAADTAAPAAPTNLRRTGGTSSSVDLAWNAATDDVGVSRYEVWRGDRNWGSWTLVGTVPASTLSYRVTGLSAGTGYTFGIRAFDAAGNKSASSNAVAVTP